MKKFIAVAAFAASILCAGDVKGTWTGQVNRPDGSKHMDIVLELTQDGDTVSGKIGADSGDRVEIQKAKFQDDTLTFEVPTNNATFAVKLKLEGETLKGAALRDGQESQAMVVEVKRSSR